MLSLVEGGAEASEAVADALPLPVKDVLGEALRRCTRVLTSLESLARRLFLGKVVPLG